MGRPDVHSRLIAAAAREVLRPLGFQQRGRSRVWFADHGWWLIVIEFQPSAWSRGAYLNVAAKWLWTPTNYWSFDFSIGPSSRIEEFRQFEGEEQFAVAARTLAEMAADEATRLRSALATISSVADRLAEKAARGGWDLYHAGIAAFLAGRQSLAQDYFTRLSLPDHDDHARGEWLRELRESAAKYAALSDERERFLALLTDEVKQARHALRLPEWEGQLPGSSLHLL